MAAALDSIPCYVRAVPTLTPTPALDALLDLALSEDIGCGDVTTEAIVSADQVGGAHIRARERLVFCGSTAVDRLLWRYGPVAPAVTWQVAEGALVEPDTVVGVLDGRLRDLLVIERTALNLLQRMSGVATHTKRYVDVVAGTSARVVDTRKTLPGHRLLDKYAVRVGGAVNHRHGLDGGVLIKDNHLVCAGGITAAVERARRNAPHSLRIEVEVETPDQLDEALAVGADVVLIDNFSPVEARAAVRQAAGRAIIEASGGITLDTVRAFADAGVDLIAVGALTHSAVAVDLSMDVRAA